MSAGRGGFRQPSPALRPAAEVAAPAPAHAPRELSDTEAVACVRRGDAGAYRILVERYQGRVYRLCARVLGDGEQARDAVQETFLKVYRKLDRFEGRSSFYTWLYRIAMNLCLDMRRRERADRGREVAATPTLEDLAAEAPSPERSWPAPVESPHAALERRELHQAVARAIERLPASSRRTLLLREVDGLSYGEIAEVLEIPRGTVMSRLHYARRRVQEVLREVEGIDIEDLSTAGAAGAWS